MTPFADGVSDIAKEIACCLKYWKGKMQESTDEVDQIIVTESVGRAAQEETVDALLGGTGIFIVTPPAFARWINRWKTEGLPLFNKDRLKLFAVDDFDRIYNRYGETICEQIEMFCGKESNETEVPQMLITSSSWLPQLSKYCQFGRSPALYIANYIEASVYGKTQFRFSFVQSDAKLQVVEEFLKKEVYKTKRSLIVCASDDETTEICDHLKKIQVKYTSFTQDADEADSNAALTWSETLSTEEFTVLVCSDTVLGDLSSMRNVQRLLNYSLPAHWSTLSRRFSVFFDTYHDFVQSPKQPKSSQSPFAQILVDETGGHALPRLVDFMERLEVKIPEQVQTIARKMLSVREGEEASVALCPFFLHYGIKLNECSRKRCGGRHALSSCDAPTKRMPPLGAMLKLRITTVHNPIHLSGQILAYRRGNHQKWRNWQNQNQLAVDADLKFQLQSYYANQENKVVHFPVEKGDLCAVDDGEHYHRVQILQTAGKVTVHTNLMLDIRFIDTGELCTRKFAGDLYVLPDNIKSIPPRAIDIHNLGLVPYDADLFWSLAAKVKIQKTISDFNEKAKARANCYVKASVHFRVENNIWTEKISLCEPLIDDQERSSFLYKALLNEQLAERIIEMPQLEVLEEMAQNLGMIFYYYQQNLAL